ncbi:hypothetical protein ABZN20_10235 [Methylococcus sp. ANG]|uniref:hypothetical protein n=1 Tax=Methylococcus sp. ANG TaxID=3231903 RepID=UPI00345A72BC
MLINRCAVRSENGSPSHICMRSPAVIGYFPFRQKPRSHGAHARVVLYELLNVSYRLYRIAGRRPGLAPESGDRRLVHPSLQCGPESGHSGEFSGM